MPDTLHGVIPALVTPRAPSEDEPDLTRLAELSRWMVGQSAHALFPCSSTGEAPLLSWRQRRRVIATVAESVGGAVPVLAGAGAASTAESLRLARDARDAGATHLVVLPLHFVPLTPDELYGYFAAVADGTDLPILLYNFPARTGGQNIAPDTAAKLARGHNVIGLKDSGGDLANSLAYLSACGPDFALFVGSEALIYPALMMGAAGTICAGANVLLAEIVALYRAFRAGDHAEARRIQEQLLPWRRLVLEGTFPAAVKAGMDLIGQPAGDPFLPSLPPSEAQQEAIRGLLQKIRPLPSP